MQSLRYAFLQLRISSLRLIVWAVAAAALSGCSLTALQPAAEPELVIPDFDDAKEQYGFATIYQSAMVPSPEKNKRMQQLDRLSQCYRRVYDNFPDDPKFTPLARLELADITAARNDLPGARQQYEELLQSYPDEEYVQARALFSIGLTLDAEQKYQMAKDIYKQVQEEFSRSRHPGIREIVKKASNLYFKVRQTGPSKAAARKPQHRQGPMPM